MNRVANSINHIKGLMVNKNQKTLDELHKSLDMDFIEYVRFQELKSVYVGTKLTLDEANTVYRYLGNSLETFNKQPLEVKVTLTQIFKELL